MADLGGVFRKLADKHADKMDFYFYDIFGGDFMKIKEGDWMEGQEALKKLNKVIVRKGVESRVMYYERFSLKEERVEEFVL